MEHLKKENTSIVTGQEELEKYLTFGCLFINCLCSVLLLHLVKCILIFFLHNESPCILGFLSREERGAYGLEAAGHPPCLLWWFRLLSLIPVGVGTY